MFAFPKAVSPIPQRYNLKAIHNCVQNIHGQSAVSPIPQRYNLKAIHNLGQALFLSLWGVTNTSKIQSESNSQLVPILLFNSYGVTNTSKIQSESNSQLYGVIASTLLRCHQYLKDTIWKQFTTICVVGIPLRLVSPIPQRYNLKAIHNRLRFWEAPAHGVTNTSKIQSESNSQRIPHDCSTD